MSNPNFHGNQHGNYYTTQFSTASTASPLLSGYNSAGGGPWTPAPSNSPWFPPGGEANTKGQKSAHGMEGQGGVHATRSLVLLFALSLHHVFEGLSVGLKHSSAAVWSLCIGIVCHEVMQMHFVVCLS